uniref:Group XIIA secretory phospholipase A2 n=1 Tax=Strigamia maritima TaxID=126957 RepID=T1J7P6_STRMM
MEAGLFENIHDFLKGTSDFIINVNDGISRVARGLDTVNSVINEASEEECVFTCPDGSKPVRNKSFISVPNGCGSFGVSLPDDKLPVAELRKCCDEHDICYDTCNNDKEDCDKTFRKCLFRICEKYKNVIGKDLLKGCKATAQAMYAGTMTLGCKAYKDSQKDACLCRSKQRQDL